MLDTSGATGTFDSPDIGTGKTVTITGLTLSGTDAGNYIARPSRPRPPISPLAHLTVAGITAGDKVYDGTTDVTFDTSGDHTDRCGRGRRRDARRQCYHGHLRHQRRRHGQDRDRHRTDADRRRRRQYILVQPTATANITAATLTVTGITASDKVYDGTTDATLDTTNATLTGFVAGDDVALDTQRRHGHFRHQGRPARARR